MDKILRLVIRYLLVYFSVFPLRSEPASIESQVETYVRGIKFIAAKFDQITSSGEVYSGNFWLSKEGKMMVKVDYSNGLEQVIFIIDSDVTILKKASFKNKKPVELHKCSISQTPMYAILTGSLNLSRGNFDIIEDTDSRLRVKIKKSSSFSSVDVTLVFSKYEKTGNLKNLEAWIIDDGKTEILLSFDPGYLFINDKSKIPNGTFSLPQNSN
jgi:outer membrane lipoprotein-sorting protein